MIAESYNLMINGNCSSDQYHFDIGQNVDMTPLNFVSINRLVFPKNIYQITTEFTMTIDLTTITYYVGNMTFQNILDKIQTAMGSNYVC
jgi:hypothetical protein